MKNIFKSSHPENAVRYVSGTLEDTDRWYKPYLGSGIRVGLVWMVFFSSIWIASMELSETFPHSFIIRIWLEEMAEAVSAPKWRGHITHVPSNQRRHFEDLDDIKRFIAPYLRIQQIDHE